MPLVDRMIFRRCRSERCFDLTRACYYISAMFRHMTQEHTSSHTRPPKLWQTNMIGRSFYPG